MGRRYGRARRAARYRRRPVVPVGKIGVGSPARLARLARGTRGPGGRPRTSLLVVRDRVRVTRSGSTTYTARVVYEYAGTRDTFTAVHYPHDPPFLQ